MTKTGDQDARQSEPKRTADVELSIFLSTTAKTFISRRMRFIATASLHISTASRWRPRFPKKHVAWSSSDSTLQRKQHKEQSGTYKPLISAKRLRENTDGGDELRDRTQELNKHLTQKRSDEPPASGSGVVHNVEPKTRKQDAWQVQKSALTAKFGDVKWQPRKRLSPDTLEGLRSLHRSNPEVYTTETLSQSFRVSPEAIRRILKSRWTPTDTEVETRRVRWEKRGLRKWQEMAKHGVKPPEKWRTLGVQVTRRETSPPQSNSARSTWDQVIGRERHDNPSMKGRLL